MRFWAGLALGLGLMAYAVCLGGCAEINKPCPDPMSCECPTTKNPGCAPWPTDAKKPKTEKTCYRMRMGCTPAAGETSCVAGPLEPPRQIPCDDGPNPDGGTR